MLSLFTLPHVVLKCLTFFLMRNTKGKLLNNANEKALKKMQIHHKEQ